MIMIEQENLEIESSSPASLVQLSVNQLTTMGCTGGQGGQRANQQQIAIIIFTFSFISIKLYLVTKSKTGTPNFRL